jgi:gamma-glutamylaminecyclotransferase
MATTTLFVYGTLKRGLRNHGLLAGQQFLSEACTLPHYRLYDCGPYPGMVPDQRKGRAVRGEIWRIEDAAFVRLDEFEDVRLFVRREIEIEGASEPVFAYLYVGDVSGLRECGDTWPPSS